MPVQKKYNGKSVVGYTATEMGHTDSTLTKDENNPARMFWYYKNSDGTTGDPMNVKDQDEMLGLMDYKKAKQIRKKSFGTLIAEQEGGLGESIKSAISQKTKAKVMGIKEAFDPMNIAKKMTFGSNWAPAMLGKAMGRKQEDIAHFTGANIKTSKLGRTAAINLKDNDDTEDAPTPAIESVKAIYKILKDREKQTKDWNKNDDKFDRTDKKQENLRHQELLKALSLRRAKKEKEEPTKKKVEEEKKEQPKVEKPKAEKPKGEPTKKKGAEKAPKKEEVKPTEKAPTKEPKKTAEKVQKEKPKEVKKEAEKPKEVKKEPEKVPKKEEVAPPKPSAEKPVAPKPTAGKIPTGAIATGLSGRAAQVALALGALGITSKAAIGAIVSTSAKESGLDPFKPEDGVKPWKATLDKRGIDYLYLKFPQLKPNGRVAKELNMPNGVPADYVRQVMDKGDEAWFSLVYPGGAEAYKYRGRGLIQITGKGVYKRVGDIIGVDLVSDPDAITRDFDTAAKATGAYLMSSLGRGDSKKGLAALNSFTDEKEALKVVIANVASGDIGTDKSRIDKLFDPNTNIGKTTASQLEAASKYTQLGSDAASGAKIDKSSQENSQIRGELNKDTSSSTTLNNTTVNQSVQSPSSRRPRVDDRPALVVKGDKG